MRTVPTEAEELLRRADPVMARLIHTFSPLEYRSDPDLWRSVVGSIVGQQLSVTAAATIRSRVAALGGDSFPTPAMVLGLAHEQLRACGLSRAKAEYVQHAARCWLDGSIVPDELAGLDDEEVIERLVRIRGVGRWTAEMVLLFCLGRPDVLAVDDLGIRVAVQKAYALEMRPGRAELDRIGLAWRPYRSYASLYLWRSLKPA